MFPIETRFSPSFSLNDPS